MHRLSSQMRKGLSGVLAAALIGSSMSMAAFADTTSLKEGTYDIDASLSSYCDAMGGIEFTDGERKVLKSAKVTVDAEGEAKVTLSLGQGTSFDIYTIACTPWISGDYQPGYYEADGELKLIDEDDYTTVSYTNKKSNNETVETSYITSMTFPVEVGTEEYNLWYYLDSNVMGCQFCDGSGTAGSNTPDTATKYKASLTLDWDSVETGNDEGGSNSSAATDSDADEEGVFSADMELSMYVSAMGGVEFGEGILQGNKLVQEDEDGNYTATLTFCSGTVNIYSVTANTYIDKQVTPGYYVDGTVKDAQYTTSGDKVTTMTFPVKKGTSEYTLWLYLNSDVMGCQFGDGNGDAASNKPGESTPYAATLTIDWDTLKEGSSSAGTSTGKDKHSMKIEYVVEGDYVVEIPSELKVDSVTKEGKYTVEVTELPEGGYVVVTADSEGVLTNENKQTVTFTNTLTNTQDSDQGNKITEAGDTLNGLVKVTGKGAKGTYTGTLNFTINCY